MSVLGIINQFANYLFLSFVVGIPLYGVFKKINVFDAFVHGAKNGFDTVIKIFPYLVAMLVAIGMLRASGFFEVISAGLGPLLNKLGIPTEVLPLIFIRPFSGSAATGIMADVIHNSGGNSYTAYLAATIMGGTETTLYVVAVYFGAVNVKNTRYAIPAGLLADLAGVIAAIAVCSYMFVR